MAKPAGSPFEHGQGPIEAGEVAQPEGTDSTAVSQSQNTANQSIDKGATVVAQSGNDAPLPDADTGKPTAAVADVQHETKKKKRKKKTPKSRKNITGFEGKSVLDAEYVLNSDAHPSQEYYADAPMTPAEALQKKDLYSM